MKKLNIDKKCFLLFVALAPNDIFIITAVIVLNQGHCLARTAYGRIQCLQVGRLWGCTYDSR